MSNFVAFWTDEGRRLRESLAREADVAEPGSTAAGEDAPASTTRRSGSSADVSLAIERLHVKREIAAALSRLEPSDRRGVLLDLLGEVALVEQLPDSAGVLPNQAGAIAMRRRPGRPASEDGPVANRSLALLETLRANPRTPTSTLAEIAYGSRARKHRDRVRALLAALKRRGLVRSAGPGLWEALPLSGIAASVGGAAHETPAESTRRTV